MERSKVHKSAAVVLSVAALIDLGKSLFTLWGDHLTT